MLPTHVSASVFRLPTVLVSHALVRNTRLCGGEHRRSGRRQPKSEAHKDKKPERLGFDCAPAGECGQQSTTERHQLCPWESVVFLDCCSWSVESPQVRNPGTKCNRRMSRSIHAARGIRERERERESVESCLRCLQSRESRTSSLPCCSPRRRWQIPQHCLATAGA